MKEWTREEVERLVPDHSTVCTSVMFDEDSAKWEQSIVDALLQTQLDLEWYEKTYEPQAIESVNELNAEIHRLRCALERIEKWELPETGEYWDDQKKEPVSFTAQYGSNGARDFIRNIAREAIKATK